MVSVKAPSELVGCQVWRTSFDYQVRLTLVARHPDEGYRVDAELVIEVPFLLRDATGEWHDLDPGSGAALAPALDLFQMTITEPAVGETGSLTLGFDSGAQLVVTPHPQFEAWSLAGHGVPPVSVGPGGERNWQH
jgi:hypothetical protein